MVGRRDNVTVFIDGYSGPVAHGYRIDRDSQGDGNQDQYIGSDGYHRNGPGQTYYQGRLTEELRDIPLRAGP